MVIHGASGDLTRRKLIPSLMNLRRQGLLSKNFAVVGVARRDKTDAEFRDEVLAGIAAAGLDAPDPADWAAFSERLYHQHGDFAHPATYMELKTRLDALDQELETGGNQVHYLSVPPDGFVPIVEGLGHAGLLTRSPDPYGPFRRVIVEKPFGHDLDSAVELDRKLSAVLAETQVYRIDHYLGKETVQNILAFRFGNGIFEPVWNRRYVDHVQITVAESIGVGSRGSFYEGAGAMRDMLQSHMLHVMALLAMEPPAGLKGESVRAEKAKVLQAVRPMRPEQVLTDCVRGQYGAGAAADGARVKGYRQEDGVAPDSHTETYAAMRLTIENWRWAGVPFYLRTGKRLTGRSTEMVVRFRQAPLMLFGDEVFSGMGPNRLIVRVQPCEGISLHVRAKTPGPGLRTQRVSLDFDYGDLGAPKATGYETLLYDCMTGDQTLFHRIDTVEAAWRIATPVLETWAAIKPHDFPNYDPGTWGPVAADELLAREGHEWWTPTC